MSKPDLRTRRIGSAALALTEQIRGELARQYRIESVWEPLGALQRLVCGLAGHVVEPTIVPGPKRCRNCGEGM